MTRVEPQVAAWGIFLFKPTKSVKQSRRFQKTRNGEPLWKLPQLRKSTKVAFGTILLDDFLKPLGKASRENVLGFPTVPTAPAAISIQLKHKGGQFFQRKRT
jgi:hypothetical protein